ncbi:uncharacterized protein LOC128873016 [Hylaeus volcanicus]|uniref:uncharacterized protein LOC128873016 n=1 Tax=Hylaeus volcanicus TaxID=313075 RepID=UPI0023B8226A|nr:uncharacterized protein LOC128873016 [Hylaeus volcanicus]
MWVLITGVPSPFYGTYRDQNVGERTIDSPPKYVALRDLFLPPENDFKQSYTNRQQWHDPSFEYSLYSDRSYAGGSYLDEQNATEECVEITDRNPISRRLEYSDFETNGSFRDASDFCFNREYAVWTPSKVKSGDSGKCSFKPIMTFRKNFHLRIRIRGKQLSVTGKIKIRISIIK